MTTIPQDFLDIDSNADHWRKVEYDGKTWIVPATETGDGHRLTDMTDAMMGPVAQMDNTVEPIRLDDKPWYKFMMAFLMQDGNLGVPGGRYGRDTRDCALIAIIMSIVMAEHNGEEITYYSLNSDMGQVVNGADGVAELLSESQYIFDSNRWGVNVKELLGDEYEPQTPAEKLVKYINDNIAFVDANEDSDGSVSINCDDEDGVNNLLELINKGGD